MAYGSSKPSQPHTRMMTMAMPKMSIIPKASMEILRRHFGRQVKRLAAAVAVCFVLAVPAHADIAFVESAQGDTAATFSSSTSGHLAIVCAYRDGNNTAPTIPMDYAVLPTGTSAGTGGANTNSFSCGYKVLGAGETSTGTWTNASSVIVHIYSGQHSTTPIGDVGSRVGLGTVWQGGADHDLTLDVTDGSSWVASFGGIRDETANAYLPTISGGTFTARENDNNAGEDHHSLDTNAGQASGDMGDANSTGVATIGHYTLAVEIVAEPAATSDNRRQSFGF